MLHDSPSRYGIVTRFFHWLVAILIIQQFFKFADRINEGEHWLGDTFGPYHVSIGAVLFILMIARLIWSAMQKQRPAPNGQLGKLAKGGHHLMYFLVITMPPLGALYIHGKGYPIKVFGYELIAKPDGKPEWAHMIGELHSIFAWVLVLLVIAHIGAAIYHHAVRKDDTLKRII
ncbi:cytochrome b [Methylophaga sp. OBS3]|uniref:cytochrome b n=1 Tax=Methylophaga sp. OBS3 TaxID=2991934 RepID=UPI00225445C2|nr:cytochrome b [Methylophaga sp. OBS3]MCX4189315.1 cytochrome b [Methylophaga sp. OBS3]